MHKILVILVILVQGSFNSENQHFILKEYTASAKTELQILALADYYKQCLTEHRIEFLQEPDLNVPFNILVTDSRIPAFEAMLRRYDIPFLVKQDTILIPRNMSSNDEGPFNPNFGPYKKPWLPERLQLDLLLSRELDWYKYHRYATIEAFIQHLPRRQEINTTVEIIGKSYEGRNIYAVKISSSPNNRKAVVIDAGVHAREWLTSAVATWIINEWTGKTKNYLSSHLEGIDYYIIPVVNPDGLEFTHTSDRMWRKNRRQVNDPDFPNATNCFGVDLNRNSPFLFRQSEINKSPCAQTYPGTFPHSEPESKAHSRYIYKLLGTGVDVKAYISLHTSGQLWIVPYGHANHTHAYDQERSVSLGLEATTAMQRVHGMKYRVGTSPVLFGTTTDGAMDDWAKAIGIKYSTTLELRGDQGGLFILPAMEIVPTAQELMAGLQVVAQRVLFEN